MTALAVPASSGAKAMKVLAEYIHLPQYLKTKWRGLLKGRHIYDNNGMNRFWEDAQNGRIQPNDVVCLKNVILTEWFPRAPGAHLGWQKGNAARHDEPRGLERPVEDPKIGPEKRTGYWSERLPPAHGRNAGPRSKRVSASLQNIAFLGDKLNDQTHIFEGSEEYLVLSPKRKTLVVRSGFGNLRFSLKPEGRLLCAVGHSYGCPNAAEGIPVLVRPQRYDKIADRVRSGVVVDIEGVYAKLPSEIDKSVWRVKDVPRYCLIVESQMQIAVKNPYSGPLACYAWTLFEYPGEQAAEYAFVYAPFDGSKPGTVRVATDFIEQYLRQYHGTPITDFDEEVPRLDAQVKLGDLMNDRIDFAKLEQRMATVKAGVDQHDSRMLLMAIRGGGTLFVAP